MAKRVKSPTSATIVTATKGDAAHRLKRPDQRGQRTVRCQLEAATILATRPEAMQLRYLGALMTIANERSSTIVFPFPTDLGQILGSARLRADGGSSESEGRS